MKSVKSNTGVLKFGVLSDSDFPEHYNPVSEQRSQVRTHITTLQDEIAGLNQYMLGSQHIIHETKDLYSRWEHLTFEDKRTIVELIVKDITVGSEEVEINLLCATSAMPPRHPLLKDGKKGNKRVDYFLRVP